MKCSLPLFALASGILLLGGARAKADPSSTPGPTWNYSFAFPSPDPTHTGTTNPNPNTYTIAGDQGGAISFTSATGTPPTGSSQIILANLRAASSVPAGGVYETISPSAGAWNGNLTITVGSDSGTINGLGGNISAQLNAGGTLPVSSTFNSLTGKSVTVGGYTFTVQSMYYQPPPNPNPASGNGQQSNPPGEIGATILVAPATVTGSVNTPEPSTMLLCVMGLACLGGARKARRRKSALVSEA